LLLGQILPVFSLVVLCTGRARHRLRQVSVRRWTFTTDRWVRGRPARRPACPSSGWPAHRTTRQTYD